MRDMVRKKSNCPLKFFSKKACKVLIKKNDNPFWVVVLFLKNRAPVVNNRLSHHVCIGLISS